MCYKKIMRNTDVYEHLAKVYFDNTSGKKRKSEASKRIVRIFLRLGVAILVAFCLLIVAAIFWQNKPPSQVTYHDKPATVVVGTKITKINLGKSNLKKNETVVFDLKELDLAGCTALGFSLRKTNYQDKLLVRVELVDDSGNQSETYINKMPAYKWEDLQIPLDEFKGMSEISKVRLLAFVVEQWQAETENATFYIDNIRFIR